MENARRRQFEYKPFQSIFHEIAELLFLLKSNPQKSSTIAVALLVTNARLLEGIANSILVCFQANPKLLEGFDRLSVINKFDLALLVKGKKLDLSLVNNINDLIKKRDSLVHPKNIKTDFRSLSKSSSGGTINFETEKNPVRVTEDEAKDYLIKTFKFLDKYFISWAMCSEEERKKILFELVFFDNGESGIMQRSTLSDDKSFIEDTLKIKIRFFNAKPCLPTTTER